MVVATIRTTGATSKITDSMQFIEVVLLEPDEHIVALAGAYFFPPFQPSLLPRAKGGPIIPTKLPSKRTRLVVYNKRPNETSIWIVELSKVHAVTRGGHYRGLRDDVASSDDDDSNEGSEMSVDSSSSATSSISDSTPAHQVLEKMSMPSTDAPQKPTFASLFRSNCDLQRGLQLQYKQVEDAVVITADIKPIEKE
ncbi:hypothetical protein K2173_001106 [Erythroxylum novogranatense]|uniref:Amine oxidase n=1 Tax=Erythroxylum novogranatense TaxID=1862640 RepID=A0AAV8SJ12_9ROSI|nr:hypothetical protein K2173_001106 [Erythroxylum novogranatense]